MKEVKTSIVLFKAAFDILGSHHLNNNNNYNLNINL